MVSEAEVAVICYNHFIAMILMTSVMLSCYFRSLKDYYLALLKVAPLSGRLSLPELASFVVWFEWMRV